jgi:hypothetical protein
MTTVIVKRHHWRITEGLNYAVAEVQWDERSEYRRHESVRWRRITRGKRICSFLSLPRIEEFWNGFKARTDHLCVMHLMSLGSIAPSLAGLRRNIAVLCGISNAAA